MKISKVRPGISLEAPAQASAGSTGAAVGQIGQTFSQALDSLSQSQASSDALIQQLAAGEEVDVHQVMIAVEETDINFRIALAIRDRLIEAYRDVMRMAV